MLLQLQTVIKKLCSASLWMEKAKDKESTSKQLTKDKAKSTKGKTKSVKYKELNSDEEEVATFAQAVKYTPTRPEEEIRTTALAEKTQCPKPASTEMIQHPKPASMEMIWHPKPGGANSSQRLKPVPTNSSQHSEPGGVTDRYLQQTASIQKEPKQILLILRVTL